MMGYWKGDWGFGEWLAMIAFMMLFWGLMVAVFVGVTRKVRGGRRAGEPAPRSTADLDGLLAARLARGEISEAEYQRGHDLLHPAGHAN